MQPFALTLALLFGAIALASVAITGSRARRALGFSVSLTMGAVAPAFAPLDAPLGRLIVAFAAVGLSLRATDLARRATEMSPWRRFAHIMSIADSERIVRAEPRIDSAALARLAASAPLAVIAAIAARELRGATGPLQYCARTASMVVMVYVCVEILFAAARLVYGAVGFAIPPLHRDPLLSRSLREFWSERWNLVVHESLRRHAFLPLARRGYGRSGMAVAFTVSAALHVYFIGFVAGPRAGLLAGLFFLLQGALVSIERPLRVERWPTLAARAWTALALLGSAPLFVQGLPGALGF